MTVTITGTNDAPIISGGPDNANLNETDAKLAASDTLTLSDVDTSDSVSVDHSLVVSGTSDRNDPAAPSDATLEGMLELAPTTPVDGTENSDTFDWTFDSGSEAFDYLATGKTLILTYTITATDSHECDPTDVTSPSPARTDDPMISGGPDSANLNETDAGLTTTDTLTLSDVDTTDSVQCGSHAGRQRHE